MQATDMIIKSVSDVKRNYSKVIKEIEKEDKPALVMNHHTPEAVIMSYQNYKNVIEDVRLKIDAALKKIDQIEDEELLTTVESRLKNINNIWLTSEEVFGSKIASQENPYSKMTDEELFD